MTRDDDLEQYWSQIEARIDQSFDAGNSCIDPTDDTDVFEQGVSHAAADLIDILAGLEGELDNGLLLSRYRIIKPLGSGGMGEVYLAERADGQYSKQVALKILSPGMTTTEFLERFHREVQLLAELRHPGIATLLDAGITEDGRPWFAQEYIDGVNLKEFCEQHHLQPQAVISLFLDICRAVRFIHEQGMIHRDLKPENILVEGTADQANPVILDFGIAFRTHEEHLTQQGSLLGTPAYASPEQIRGNARELDQRSDIFSLGVLLYELVEKKRPFTGEGNADISYKILHQDPFPLKRPGISRDLSAVIFKCLHKAPENRYQQVQELIDDLEKLLAGKPVSANPVNALNRLKRHIYRHPGISLLIFITLLLIASLSALSWKQQASMNRFASKQAETAQHFSQTAQHIAASTQLIYSRPLHDIEPEMQRLNDKYLQIRRQLENIDPSSAHVAHYALGYAAWTLGRLDEAHVFLQQAWDDGLHDPLLALRLGQTHFQLYHRALQALNHFNSADTRQRLFNTARQAHLQPAREFMALGRDAPHEDAAIARALLSFWEDDLDNALTKLINTRKEAAWPVNAFLTEADIHLELGELVRLSGDHEQAFSHYRQSEKLFAEAMEIARSHPDVLKGRCLALQHMAQSGDYQALHLSDPDVSLVSPCENLLALEPHNAEFMILAGWAYLAIARKQLIHGDDTTSILQKARRFSDAALDILPNDSRALHLGGSIRLTEAKLQYEKGRNPETILNRASLFLEKAVSRAPGNRNLAIDFSQSLQQLARAAYNRGQNGDIIYRKAGKILEQFLQHETDSSHVFLEYANLLSWQGYYRYSTGRDSESVLNKAIALARRAVEKMPNDPDAIKALALATWTYAEFLYLKNTDPAHMVQTAMDSYQSIIDQDPGNCVARFNQLGAMALSIDYALDHARSQKAQLQQMQQRIDELRDCIDEDREMSLVLADYWRYRAKQSLIEGTNPSSALEQSRRYNDNAMHSEIDSYEAVQSMARLMVLEHHWQAGNGREDPAGYKQDLATLTQAVNDYPDLPLLRIMRGRFLLIGNPDDARLEQAIEDLSSALRDNPLLSSRYHGDLQAATAQLQR